MLSFSLCVCVIRSISYRMGGKNFMIAANGMTNALHHKFSENRHRNISAVEVLSLKVKHPSTAAMHCVIVIKRSHSNILLFSTYTHEV